MDKERNLVFVLLVNIVPAILNFIVMRLILLNTNLIGYDLFIIALGTFSLLSSLHSQLVPTLIYTFEGSLNKLGRQNISDIFKISNIIFAVVLMFFVYPKTNIVSDVLIVVFGIMFWNHSVISLDYYLVDVNLSKNFKKGSLMTLIIFFGKLTAGIVSIIFIENLIYFFLIDAIIVGCLFRFRGVFKIPYFSLKNGFVIKNILVVYSRILYFILLPWAFYLGSIEMPLEKSSFFLGERIFFGGVGLFITPLIPLVMLSEFGNKLKLNYKLYLGIVVFSLIYFLIVFLLFNLNFYPEIIYELTGISGKVFYGFILILPLHILISYLSRLSLKYDKTRIVSYMFVNLGIVLAGIILFYSKTVLFYFSVIFIVQLILLFNMTLSFRDKSLLFK